jgi:hypothetical protein
MMVALLFACLLSEPADPIKWQLSLGDSWSYRLKQTFLPARGATPEDEQVFVYDGKIRVTGLKTDEIDFSVSARLVEQRSGGIDLPTSSIVDTVVKRTFTLLGAEVLQPDRYASEEEFRLYRLLWFGFPPTTGTGSWKVSWNRQRPNWGAPAEVEYERTGSSQHYQLITDVFRVRYREFDRAPMMSAEGRADVDQAHGVLMVLNLKAKNAVVPGGEGLYDLDLQYHVTDLPKFRTQSGSK